MFVAFSSYGKRAARVAGSSAGTIDVVLPNEEIRLCGR